MVFTHCRDEVKCYKSQDIYQFRATMFRSSISRIHLQTSRSEGLFVRKNKICPSDVGFNPVAQSTINESRSSRQPFWDILFRFGKLGLDK